MKLTARAAEAQAEPLSLGGLTDQCFHGSVTRWKAAGIRPVPMHIPRSVRELMNAPPPRSGWLGADRLMIPSQWDDTEEPPRRPDLWCLRHARVFGGANVGRTYEPLPAGAEGWHWNGQTVLTDERQLIPASYGTIDGNHTMPRELMIAAEDGLHLIEPPEPRFLEGTHILLGNLQPHFGHALLEGLTRTWASVYLHPSMPVKWLMYEPVLRAFRAKLLAMAGIKGSMVVQASPYDVVERLIVPDVGMRTHRWITSAQGLAWDRIARRSEPVEKVFLSRADIARRRCSNQDRVEAMFAKAGWRIVQPETLTIRDQIKLAGRARRIAGCSGSQLFLSAFQADGGDNIVIAPKNFMLRDDLLIASLRRHRLQVAFGDLVDFGTEDRTWAADLDRVAAVLHEESTVRGKVSRRVRSVATTAHTVGDRLLKS